MTFCRYVLRVQRTCPQPYADADDGVNIPCTEGEEKTEARGLLFSTRLTGLQPYTAYRLSLQAYNSAGGLERPANVVNNTLPAGIQAHL